MHTVEHEKLRAHFNSDLSGDVQVNTEGVADVMVLPGELVRKIAEYALECERRVIVALRAELQNLRNARDLVLATEVYDAVTKIAALRCQTKALLGGEDCGKCGPCIAKPIEKVMREQAVRASWSDWQAKLGKLRQACRLESVGEALEAVSRYGQPQDQGLAKWALTESEES